MKTIKSLDAFNQQIKDSTAVLAYFSHERCNVCKVLKPKLSETFKNQFPKIEQIYVDVDNTLDIAAQYSVFTVPVIIVFFEGKETYRNARNISISELVGLVERPYHVIFD
ncbi:MAG: thioredoxin family protein [Salinivirgaceae bacterium]